MKLYGAGQGRFVGLHRQAQQIFDPAIIDGDVERDLLAFLVFRFHHPALGDDDRIQQVSGHRVQ